MVGRARSLVLRCGLVLLLTLTVIGWVTAQQFSVEFVVLEFLSNNADIDLVPGADVSIEGEWVLPDGRRVTQTTFLGLERCLAHGFTSSGQDYYVSGSDYYVSGSIGGKMLGIPFDVTDRKSEASVEVTSKSLLDFQNEYLGLSAQITLRDVLERLARESTEDVAIIVADDFAGGHFKIPDEVFGFRNQDSDKRDLQAMVDSGKLSHGALVLHTLNALIATSEQFSGPNLMDVEAGVFEWSSPTGTRLVVRGVDLSTSDPTAPITSTTIATRIADSINFWSDQVTSVEIAAPSHFVVNMSWVLLPCATVEAFLKAKNLFPDYRTYILALEAPEGTSLAAAKELYESGASEDGREFVEAMMALLSWVPATNPVYQLTHFDDLLARDGQGSRIAFVASAGNFFMPYQMLPAAWDHVVGVGSPNPVEQSPASTQPPPFSNYYADVVAPGAWFHLQPELAWDPTDGDGQLSYAGTSYSAPIVSLVTALDIASKSYCTKEWRSNDRPGLAPEVLKAADTWLADALSIGPPYCSQAPLSDR